MLKVLSVDCPIENENVTNISFMGNDTFLDADVLILNPDGITIYVHHRFDNSRGLNYSSADTTYLILAEKMIQRRNEIVKLLSAGKIIISFLPPIIKIYNSIGRFEYTNYSWTPYPLEYLQSNFVNGNGKSVILNDKKHIFAAYFYAFKDNLQYFLHWNNCSENDNVFFKNNAGYPTGWGNKQYKGQIFFLPPPPKDYDKQKLYGVLINASKRCFDVTIQTPEPPWIKKIELPGEQEFSTQILKLQNEIDELTHTQSEYIEDKQKLLNYKHLLYENGKNLEDAVISSFHLMGFSANRYVKDDMEHDVILIASEGRAIAEIEGRDNDAIHIEKLDQLNRVVDEDFKEHEDFAQGLLIGNPYRLLPLDERKTPFTEKVRIFVEKKNFKLLTTVELFKAVDYILKNPNDEVYKLQCRKKIFENPGQEIQF